MTVSRGPEVTKILEQKVDQDHPLSEIKEQQDLEEIEKRLQQTEAANGISDLFFPPGRLRAVRENCYRLRLKLKWKGPFPVALEIRFIDQQLWEVEIVKDDEGKDETG